MAVTTDGPVHRKRLIVCCDGTWQSSVDLKRNIPSNVTRLARSFVRSDETNPDVVWDQIVYYDAGIGTGSISTVEAVREGSVGAGFSGNVIEAYNFLVLNYKPGDKVYCFGFSRGAYTARAVAGLVNDIGIISARDMQDFPELYQKYQWPDKDCATTNPNWFRKSVHYREWLRGVPARAASGGVTHIPGTTLKLYEQFPHEKVSEASRQVEVVGVFDTVGALGVPDTAMHSFNLVKSGIRWATGGGTAPGFHNVSLSKYTRHAYHALALDEHRGPFSPTLWHLPKDEETDDRTYAEREEAYESAKKRFEELDAQYNQYRKDELKYHTRELKSLNAAWGEMMDRDMDCHKCTASQDYLDSSKLEQVWFPGYHCNIGGGDSDALDVRKGDLEQIALISFAWMCDKLRPHLRFEHKLRKRTVGDRMAMINPILAEIEAGGNKDFGHWTVKPFWKVADAIVPRYDCPQKLVSELTKCGWATGPIVDSFTFEYTLAKDITRTPGRYGRDENGEDLKLGATNELLHPCIAYRMAMLQGARLGVGEAAYIPKGLIGFKRIYHKEKWVWVQESALTKVDGNWKWLDDQVGDHVEELKVDANLKFSYFMAKDHLKYLDESKIQESRADKVIKEKEPAESKAVCDTLAIRFLETTKSGVQWVAPEPQTNEKQAKYP